MQDTDAVEIQEDTLRNEVVGILVWDKGVDLLPRVVVSAKEQRFPRDNAKSFFSHIRKPQAVNMDFPLTKIKLSAVPGCHLGFCNRQMGPGSE